MTLDEIRRMVEALPPGPWVLEAGGMAIMTPGHGDEQVRAQHAFIVAARTLLPALLDAVAAAEQAWSEAADCRDWRAFSNALDTIEALPALP